MVAQEADQMAGKQESAKVDRSAENWVPAMAGTSVPESAVLLVFRMAVHSAVETAVRLAG
jgi:hypothetical protein